MRRGQFQTHCKRGHLRSPENLDDHRSCKLCAKERDKVRSPEKIARIRAYQRLHPEEHARKMREWAKTDAGKLSIRASKLKQLYGLSLVAYEDLRTKQGNKCPLCSMQFGDTWETLPRVDHNHACCPGQKSCGKCVRGLLCSVCNSMLGLARDNPETLQAGIQYLKETQKCPSI